MTDLARAAVIEHCRQAGRKGGPARAAKLSPAQRKRIARKAGLASGKARRAKKRQQGT